MSGSYCPNCYQLTFFLNNTGRKCSKCGHSEVDPAREYRGDGIPGGRFNIDSLKMIGATTNKPKSVKKPSAQSDLNKLINKAKKMQGSKKK